MKIILKTILALIALVSIMTSCGVNSNVMFKEAKGAEVRDSIPLKPVEDLNKLSIFIPIVFIAKGNFI